ncbi:major facilitator superfamily domain-containing protein [Xylariaceae sp. FL1651]|nr:major facilitator superfamily domain-containing protein [Xylariaceae sp. FL1651]
MAVGTFVLVGGRLGEIFGHKRMFILGIGWSAAWSAVVGASSYTTETLFLISRAFQGLGAALTLPSGLALLGVTYPAGVRERMVLTLYATMSPIGLLMGAVGASTLTLAWWPWTYWAFSMTSIVIMAVGSFAIPSASRAAGLPVSARATITELDVPGMIAGVTSLALFGFAWNQAQTTGWQQPYLWIALIISVLLGALFVMIENCYAPKPLIPFSKLTPEALWILIVVACGWSCFGIWIFYSWRFMEDLRSASPLLSTAYLFPLAVVGCLSVVCTGLMPHRVSLYAVLCLALLMITAGGILVATMPIVQIYWAQLFASTLTMSWGLYTSVPAAMLLISNAVDKTHYSVTASLVTAITYYSIALGLGVAGTVKRNMNNGSLGKQSRLNGYKNVFWTSVGLAGLGFVICLALALRSSGRQERVRCCKCHSIVADR